jgi:poly-gamma-glutamate capsule biosynthesis protein CapA/YwtB (metallophosphatase superfamily)
MQTDNNEAEEKRYQGSIFFSLGIFVFSQKKKRVEKTSF